MTKVLSFFMKTKIFMKKIASIHPSNQLFRSKQLLEKLAFQLTQ